MGATVASTCANCVAKKYSAANASTVYTDCPAGKTSAAIGASSSGACASW
jgi:hypothetical protein